MQNRIFRSRFCTNPYIRFCYNSGKKRHLVISHNLIRGPKVDPEQLTIDNLKGNHAWYLARNRESDVASNPDRPATVQSTYPANTLYIT